MTYRKKLIEVAMPLDAINVASAREKSIRHGHPSTLHLWWARRPLAAARSVLFGQLVDDPSAWPGRFPTEAEQDKERQRIFRIIEQLVKWKNSTNEVVLGAARAEIAKSYARGRVADGKGEERDKTVIKAEPGDKAINSYLAEVLPPVHDPFAGGGSIPLEAQRLGLRAIATDLNPVAVMINKALIEIPPKFAGLAPVGPPILEKSKQTKLGVRTWEGGQGLAEDVRRYGAWMREEAFKKIGHLYPKVKITKEIIDEQPNLKPYKGTERTIIAWIWTRTVKCPNPGCGSTMPLVKSFALSTKKGKRTWVEPVVQGNNYTFKINTGQLDIPKGTVNRTGARCICCDTPVPFKHIRSEGKANRITARMMAIVVEGKRSRIYLPPTKHMETLAASMPSCNVPNTDLPKKALGFRVQEYGMIKHKDLFTHRQLTALTTFSDLLIAVQHKIASDALDFGMAKDELGLAKGGLGAKAYSEAIVVLLSFAISRSVDFWGTLCVWSSAPKNEVVMHVFGKQTLQMTWDFSEVNPFSSSGGNWIGATTWIAKVCDRRRATTEGIANQEDAAFQIDHPWVQDSIVSTDPPYYDNIPYADLSDYFYVWLRRGLRSIFPKIFATLLVPKLPELIADPFRHGGSMGAEKYFLSGMTNAISNISKRETDTHPTTIYYAFKQSKTNTKEHLSTGWETFLEAVLSAGFSILGTWPVRTERPGRLRDTGSNALASSIVLVCRKRPDNATTITRGQFQRFLTHELPEALKKLYKSNIAPVDLAQASIGPGMAVFSRYAKVLAADGSPMTVRNALQLIHQVMDEISGEEEGDLDLNTRFATTWFENFGFESGPYGDAETLAKAKSVSVSGVVESGILRSAAGKVRLLKREELSADWDPAKNKKTTVWEATQYLIKSLDKDGETATALLLSKLEQVAEQARDLAYRLYTVCERRKWTEEARAYNGLVIAWPELEKLAASNNETASKTEQGDMFEGVTT